MTIAANINVTITKERDHWTNQQIEYMEKKKQWNVFFIELLNRRTNSVSKPDAFLCQNIMIHLHALVVKY
jgi:hypothetical protein